MRKIKRLELANAELHLAVKHLEERVWFIENPKEYKYGDKVKVYTGDYGGDYIEGVVKDEEIKSDGKSRWRIEDGREYPIFGYKRSYLVDFGKYVKWVRTTSIETKTLIQL